MEEKKLKCASCGANIKEEEKYCSYCGSLNAGYKEKKVEEVSLPTEENDLNDDLNDDSNDDSNDDLDDMFGGFLGGVMLGGALHGMGRLLNGRSKRR